MTVHQLKSWPEMFNDIVSGTKRFELRRNDRDFQVGDHLLLREYEPSDHPDGATARYTGREIAKRISYVMRGIGSVGTIAPLKGLAMGYVILGLEDIDPQGARQMQWTCGHVAGAMCQECYRLLAARANELAEENLKLRERSESAP